MCVHMCVFRTASLSVRVFVFMCVCMCVCVCVCVCEGGGPGGIGWVAMRQATEVGAGMGAVWAMDMGLLAPRRRNRWRQRMQVWMVQ
jgi:hypothetical protein